MASRTHPTITLLAALCFAGVLTAQPFEPREPFGEPYGSQWNLVLNAGQTYDLGDNWRGDVAIQSVGTTPSLYLFKNSGMGFTYADPVTNEVVRIDLRFTGEMAQNITPGLYHQTGMVYNFYETNTPDGITGVEAGKHAVYEDVYPDIDFHVLSNPWGPKFYIVIRPGGDPTDLNLQVSGHDSLKIDVSGDLKIWFDNQYLRLREGYAYQQQGDSIVDVPWVAHYENNMGSSNVTFELGSYDPELPLILCIKPWLPPMPPPPPVDQPEWSTYFAGDTYDDFIKDLTHDSGGNVYFTGASKSTNGLPVTPGLQETPEGQQDMIVGKINQYYEIETSGTWMTYFGGGDNDRGDAIAYTDIVTGRLAVCGASASGGTSLIYPIDDSWTTNGFNLLALFDPATGHRTYCTRLPHVYPPQIEFGGPADLGYDDSGNLYLTGSGDLTNSTFNGYVTGPNGNTDYTSQSYFNSNSTLLYQDAYVARFDADMHLTWLTALAGPGDDRAYALTVDNVMDRLIVVGKTASKNNESVAECPPSGQYDFPLCYPTNSYRQYLLNGSSNCDDPTACGTDGFVTVFDLGDLHILYSSYFGSGGGTLDALTDVVTDESGNIFMVGWDNDGAYANNVCGWGGMDYHFVSCGSGGYMDPNIDGGYYSHFIARLNAGFHETWATKIEGKQYEYLEQLNELSRPRLAIDQFSNIYMYGSTASGSVLDTDPIAPFHPDPAAYSNFVHADGFGVTPTSVYDTYVLMFNNSTELIWSTLFGGPGQDYAAGITAFNDRVYICGSTESPLFPTNAPTISGASPYLVETASVANDDKDAFMAQLRFDFTIGQSELGQPLSVSGLLYPNPATDILTISGLDAASGGTVQVLDVLGRSVMETKPITSSTLWLNIAILPPGGYLVRTMTPTGIYSRRFVKQ